MNGSVCLQKESYLLLRELRRKKLISSKLYAKLEDCSHPNYLGGYFVEEYDLTREKIRFIWEHIKDKYVYWEYANRRKSWNITQCQNKFLDMLLANGGAITRQDVMKKGGLTDGQMKRHLEFMNYDPEDDSEDDLPPVDIIFTIKSNKRFESKVTYVLHPELLNY
jgi:hypothetical protein